jgi:hypothetical protein
VIEEFTEGNIGRLHSMPGQKPFAQCLGQVASWNAHAGKKNSVVAEDLEQ